MESELPALRITAGVHQGAVIRLDAADMLVIGSSDDCDVILADSGVTSHHCLLKKQAGQLLLRSIEGALTIKGIQQKQGETVLVSPGVPVSIGGAEFEIVTGGVAGSGDSVASAAATRPSAPGPTQSRAPLSRAARMQQLLRSRPLSATAIAVALVGSVVAVGAVSLGNKGRLTTAAGNDSAAVAALTTRSGAAIAHDVAEVLRLSGIACEAHYNGDGTVTVRGHLGDSQTLATIVNSRAIREIVGLKRVMAINLDQAGRSVGSAVDGTRIVSVVASADPYVVTADGSRYYVGASLPQGGRLAGVKEGEVLVERDGRTEHWKIAEPNRGRGDFRPTTNMR
jgi:hypothetical protein